MRRLVLHPTSTAQWHSLVCEAESASNIFLDEELQSYLVFLLMRYLDKPGMTAKILALDYIDSMLSSGQRKEEKLRDVGDVCLIHAGLFPRRAKRKRVSDQYFIDLGCGAYQQLSVVVEHPIAPLYYRLSQSFLPIRDLLQAMSGQEEKMPYKNYGSPADSQSNAGSWETTLITPSQNLPKKH
ncbi:hypothetical protein [Kaarinaea lacus]